MAFDLMKQDVKYASFLAQHKELGLCLGMCHQWLYEIFSGADQLDIPQHVLARQRQFDYGKRYKQGLKISGEYKIFLTGLLAGRYLGGEGEELYAKVHAQPLEALLAIQQFSIAEGNAALSMGWLNLSVNESSESPYYRQGGHQVALFKSVGGGVYFYDPNVGISKWAKGRLYEYLQGDIARKFIEKVPGRQCFVKDALFLQTKQVLPVNDWCSAVERRRMPPRLF